MLSDSDHGHQPAGVGSDHLSPVVRDGQQQRSQIIIAVQDQLTLKGVSTFQGGGDQVLGLQGLPGGEADLDVGLLRGDDVGDPLTPDQVLDDRTPSSRRRWEWVES